MVRKAKLIFIDTNILFSVITKRKNPTSVFFRNELIPNFNVVTSQYVLDELEDVLRLKLRHKVFRKVWKLFNKEIRPYISIIETPDKEYNQEK